jgi:hypothetical protein
MQGAAWSPAENRAAIHSYMRMLLLEWDDTPYNKSAERRTLSRSLSARTDSSIEMKHRNISAILLAHGIPPIYGYKPLPNFQSALEKSVTRKIESIPHFGDSAVRSINAVKDSPEIPSLEPAEIPQVSISWKCAYSRRKLVPRDLLAAEAQAYELQHLALRAVALHERCSLIASNRKELAEAVNLQEFDERVGTGTVQSYSAEGELKTISVKATNSLAEFPFMLSSDEIDLSLDPSAGYHLYRVFGLRHRPSFYVLRGNLKASAQLTATDYTALPRS